VALEGGQKTLRRGPKHPRDGSSGVLGLQGAFLRLDRDRPSSATVEIDREIQQL
jgi:hypothetical protein